MKLIMETWRRYVKEQSDIDTSLQDGTVNWLEKLIRRFAEYKPNKSREYKPNYDVDEEKTRAVNDIKHPDAGREEFKQLKEIVDLIDRLIIKHRSVPSTPGLKLQNRPGVRSPLKHTSFDVNMWKKLFNKESDLLKNPYPEDELRMLQTEPNEEARKAGYGQIAQTLKAMLSPLPETE